jgi:hypothetical protein
MLIVLFIIFTVSYGFLSRIDGVGKVNFNKYLRNYHNSKNKILATKKKTNFFGEPHFEYSYYNEYKPIYIIIANINKESNDLLKAVKKHKVNYIFADKLNFTQDHIIETCNYFNVFDTKFILTKPLIFKGKNEYIGSTFEMYEVISKY